MVEEEAPPAAEKSPPKAPKMLAPPSTGGNWLGYVCVASTVLFVVAAALAFFVVSARGVFVWVCLALFGAGVLFFAAAIVAAGARSYREGVGVRSSGLFLGGFAAKPQALQFRVCMAATIVVSVVVSVGNSNPSPLVIDIPAMAYAILVPIVPFALAGFHGAVYCPWPVRAAPAKN